MTRRLTIGGTVVSQPSRIAWVLALGVGALACHPGLDDSRRPAVRHDAEGGQPGQRGGELWLRLDFAFPPAPEALVDFPVLVRVPAVVPTDAALRFVGRDGGRLPFEVESWGPPPERVVWVRAPRVSTDEFIWLVFGGVGPPVSFEPTAVWAPDYVGVWHFAELDEQAGSVLDSSANRLEGSCVGCGARGREPDAGLGPHLVIAPGVPAIIDDPALRAPAWREALSVEVWLNIAQSGSEPMDVVSMMGGPGQRSWDLAIESGDFAAFRTSGEGATVHYVGQNVLAIGTWYHLTGTLAAGVESRLYLDGALNDRNPDGGVTLFDNGLPLVLGRQASPAVDVFSGLIDELRLSRVTRSPAWVKATWLSARDQLLLYGPAEPGDDGGVPAADGGAEPVDGGVGDAGSGQTPDGGGPDTLVHFTSRGCSAPGLPAMLALALALARSPRRRGKR